MKLWPPPRLVEAGLLRDRSPQPAQEERAMQVTPWGPWETQHSTNTGINVTEDSALNLMAVFGCVQFISETIIGLPRHIYRDLGEDNAEEVANKPRWFKQPNPTTTMSEFLSQTLLSLLLDGNAYWVYGQDLNRTPTELFVLDPTVVDVRQRARTASDPTAVGNGQVVEYFVRGNLFRGNLLHLKGMMKPGALKGMSPVEHARQTIGIGLATERFAGTFYGNGINPSGVVSTEADLSEAQATQLARSISRTHGGVDRAHLPMVLDNGAKWSALSVTPEQAQFLASREFTSGVIAAQMFLIDPSMLGIAINRGQNLTYANLEQRGIHTTQYTLQRWLSRLEDAFFILLPNPQYMKFNVDAIMRADLLSRTQAHRIALGPNQPWKTVNEVRDLEEEAPVPGGDTLQIISSTPAPSLAPFPTNGNGQPVGASQ